MDYMMFPESYNELRKELHDHWPKLWKQCQWFMAFDWPLFIENMNRLLELRVPMDGEVEAVCTTYLSHLRRKRGQ